MRFFPRLIIINVDLHGIRQLRIVQCVNASKRQSIYYYLSIPASLTFWEKKNRTYIAPRQNDVDEAFSNLHTLAGLCGYGSLWQSRIRDLLVSCRFSATKTRKRESPSTDEHDRSITFCSFVASYIAIALTRYQVVCYRMTSVPFVYAKRLLDECAASSLAMSLSRTEPDASSPEERSFRTSLIVETSSSENDRRMKYDKSCDKLWRSYIHHYGKTEDFAKSDEACFESDTWKDEKGQQMVVYSIGPRVERFLRSVVFVHKHNDDHPTSHRVSLNRFSAFETHHLFPDSVNFEASPRRRDTEVYSDIGIGHGAKNKLHHRHSNRHRVSRNVPVKRITVPDPFRKPFQTPVVGSNLDGFLLSIKRYHLQKDKARGGDRDARTDAVDSPNGYKRFLNWATPDNPDGVPIVHDAFDQQACGSCWAFAAAGSLEASASRRAAFIAYETYRTSHRNRLNLNHTVEEEAIAVGQRVQRRAMNVLNLSVQELLDCDSITDQGCVGGNPLLAFYYIHQNGLVSWEDYPYTATADTCLMNATQDPVATVKSWGIIKSDHEKHMQLALRYIGPIAV